jgi:SAM-dependent methyltransferase
MNPEAHFEEGRRRLAEQRFAEAAESFSRALAGAPELLDDVAGAFHHDADRRSVLEALEPRIAGESGSPAAATLALGAAGCALASRLARDLQETVHSVHSVHSVYSVYSAHPVQWAERAVAAEPDCATWWFELGDAHWARGNRRQAAAAWRRCLALDPRHAFAKWRLSVVRPRRSLVADILICLPWTRHLLRRLAWTGGRLAVLEARGESAAAHQMRFTQALEQGAATAVFPGSPPGQEHEKFDQHWRACDCPFWRWFRTLGLEREVRTMIDVGCGDGYTAEHFMRAGIEATGVTVSAHEKAACLARGMKVVEADLHFLPVPDAGYDLVFSSHSLEHSVSTLFAIWEWKRIARPGGYLFIMLPMPIEQDARAAFPDHYIPERDMLDFGIAAETLTPESIRAACYTYGSAMHVYVLSYWQLTWLFEQAGLERVAAAVEDPVGRQVLGVEYVDGRLPRDPKMTLNGMFLLRKPLP